MTDDYTKIFDTYRDLQLVLDNFIAKTQDILSISKNQNGLQIFSKKRVDSVCLIKKGHLGKVLDGFMQNTLTAGNAAAWAYIIRMCDCYRIDSSEPEQTRKSIAAILLRIASPNKYGPLSVDTANYYIHCLNSGAIPTN